MLEHIKSALAAIIFTVVTMTASSGFAETKNIVLVHGMNLTGPSWRPVYDVLSEKGYNVSMVQMPLNGFQQDIAAVKRAIELQEGPVVLVGHSYGGMVITEAGNDPKVGSLVYVAALQPDVGDTMGSLNTQIPPAIDVANLVATSDGFTQVNFKGFMQDVAQDLPESEVKFLVQAQVPTSSEVFVGEISAAAWKGKPTYAVIATEDRTLNSDLQRWMYERSNSKVTEVASSHMVYISHPEEVANVIIEAAKSVK